MPFDATDLARPTLETETAYELVEHKGDLRGTRRVTVVNCDHAHRVEVIDEHGERARIQGARLVCRWDERDARAANVARYEAAVAADPDPVGSHAAGMLISELCGAGVSVHDGIGVELGDEWSVFAGLSGLPEDPAQHPQTVETHSGWLLPAATAVTVARDLARRFPAVTLSVAARAARSWGPDAVAAEALTGWVSAERTAADEIARLRDLVIRAADALDAAAVTDIAAALRSDLDAA